MPDGIRVVGSAAGSAAAAGSVPAGAENPGCKQFVCFCEDVTTKDIGLSLAEGFSSLELSKRYTTVTMGPCQGRMCHRNSGVVIADKLGLDADAQQVGVTTARPPHNPTSFALLAGRGYEPVKRTSTHHWHAEHGGKMLWAGDWKRPYDYGDAGSEVDAVHESLGLIDVSTLGKLIVRGPDAAAFLERLYPNRFGDMKLARVRYGIVCGDDGSMVDDGTVARLADDSYYVTTTSSGAGGHGAVVHLVERRLEHGRPGRQRHRVDRRGQPGRPERADGAAAADRLRPLKRGVPVPGRRARRDRRRALPDPADRVRRRAGVRDPLPQRRRRVPLGAADGGRRRSTT